MFRGCLLYLNTSDHCEVGNNSCVFLLLCIPFFIPSLQCFAFGVNRTDFTVAVGVKIHKML